MKVLYFVFYNDPNSPLDELKQEDREINQILEPLAKSNFRIVRDSFASLDAVAEKLALYQDDIVLFHFGGHAGQSMLLLEDGQIKSRGISELLGLCKNLRLVFLNGCATFGQVKHLQELGIPSIIASFREINDKKARIFSTHFYRSLSYRQDLANAYDSAIKKVLAIDDTLKAHRGIWRISEETFSEPAWGLFQYSTAPDIDPWFLPFQNPSGAVSDFEPNKFLIEKLLEALSPFSPKVQSILKDEESGQDYSILDKREAILEALPHPIGDQLRWLLVPDKFGQGNVFYDKPGINRLSQIFRLFEIVIDLLVFISLAQLWDSLNKENPPVIPGTLKAQVLHFLSLDRGEIESLQLIRSINDFFTEKSIPFFVEEIKGLSSQFEEGTPFLEAANFFESRKNDFKGLAEQEAANLSVLAEQNLGVIFSQLGFLGRYTFASVKNINVLKYRHLKEPNFQHILVKLVLRVGDLGEEPKLLKEMLDCASVLVIKNFDGQDISFLNLTPFIIDENAFDEKAQIAKLHFLKGYAQEEGPYVFRHIYMPDEKPLVISDQRPFKVIKAQFDFFTRLMQS